MNRRNHPGLDIQMLLNQMLPAALFPSALTVGRAGTLRDGTLLLDGTASLDAYRRDGNLHIHIDMPGVIDTDLHVEAVGRKIVVSGERTYTPEPGDDVIVTERVHGKITRTITLDHAVDPQNVQAHLDRGVLHLVIRRADTAGPARIEIRTGANPDTENTSTDENR